MIEKLLSLAALVAAPHHEFGRHLSLKPTIYSVSCEFDFTKGSGARFFDKDGNVLYESSKEFYENALLQGTGRLRDGRFINFSRTTDGVPRWKISNKVEGYLGKMVPYKVLAVDPNIIPIGSFVFIPMTQGMRLPNNKVHDGIWLAGDIGGDIKGNRVDVFAGVGKKSLSYLKSLGQLSSIDVFLLPYEGFKAKDNASTKQQGKENANLCDNSDKSCREAG